MAFPTVTEQDLQQFSGKTFDDRPEGRTEVLLDRARRNLHDALQTSALPSWVDADDVADYKDAVCELAWLYLEAEKAKRMELVSVPVSQLSVGTLFWTKEYREPFAQLWAVNRVLSKFGRGRYGVSRFAMEDELSRRVP